MTRSPWIKMDGHQKELPIYLFWFLVCLMHLGPGLLLELYAICSHSGDMVISRNTLNKKQTNKTGFC